MKVLLTGANGFVGSHILDQLLARGLSVAVLLRPSSDRRFIAEALGSGTGVPPVRTETHGRDARATSVEVRLGSISEPASLDAALEGVTHVIHCAGATRALNAEGFLAVNQLGTRNVVAAVNRRGTQIQRFVHISSLAAAGPATSERPRCEHDKAEPVSDYGRSKLAGEREVVERGRVNWVIIRPPAVYGPRDREFLRLFKAAKAHLLPRFGGGRQELTLVYVADLAAGIVSALLHPNAAGETFFIGAPQVVTTAQLARQVADTMGVWTLPLPLPNGVLWLACQWSELVSRLTKQANVLSAQKLPELMAPGWVCNVTRLRSEMGFECRTTLTEGLARTRDWYRAQGWL